MGRDDDIVAFEQAAAGLRRFGIGDIEAGAEKMPAIEGVGQRRFIDERSS